MHARPLPHNPPAFSRLLHRPSVDIRDVRNTGRYLRVLFDDGAVLYTTLAVSLMLKYQPEDSYHSVYSVRSAQPFGVASSLPR